MGWRPGEENGTGDSPEPCSDLPGRGIPDAPPLRHDPHVSGFAKDGEWDTCAPSPVLAATLEATSGAEWRCPGATRDELFGLLRQWQAIESWAAAGKLGVRRALIRDDDRPLPGGGTGLGFPPWPATTAGSAGGRHPGARPPPPPPAGDLRYRPLRFPPGHVRSDGGPRPSRARGARRPARKGAPLPARRQEPAHQDGHWQQHRPDPAIKSPDVGPIQSQHR